MCSFLVYKKNTQINLQVLSIRKKRLTAQSRGSNAVSIYCFENRNYLVSKNLSSFQLSANVFFSTLFTQFFYLYSAENHFDCERKYL